MKKMSLVCSNDSYGPFDLLVASFCDYDVLKSLSCTTKYQKNIVKDYLNSVKFHNILVPKDYDDALSPFCYLTNDALMAIVKNPFVSYHIYDRPALGGYFNYGRIYVLLEPIIRLGLSQCMFSYDTWPGCSGGTEGFIVIVCQVDRVCYMMKTFFQIGVDGDKKKILSSADLPSTTIHYNLDQKVISGFAHGTNGGKIFDYDKYVLVEGEKYSWKRLDRNGVSRPLHAVDMNDFYGSIHANRTPNKLIYGDVLLQDEPVKKFVLEYIETCVYLAK